MKHGKRRGIGRLQCTPTPCADAFGVSGRSYPAVVVGGNLGALTTLRVQLPPLSL